MARDININAVCAHCGELLDTNECSYAEVEDGVLPAVDLIIGTEHECFIDRDGDDDGEA